MKGYNLIKTKLSISYLNVLFTTFELRNELQTLSERIMTIVRRENNIAWSKYRQLFENVLKRSHEIFRGVVNRSHFIELLRIQLQLKIVVFRHLTHKSDILAITIANKIDK